MSKIGGWILENQETRNWIKTVNPYDRHSNTELGNLNDNTGHRNELQPRYNLVRGNAGRSYWGAVKTHRRFYSVACD